VDWELDQSEAEGAISQALPDRTTGPCLDQLIRAAPTRGLVAGQDILDHRGVLLWSQGQGVNADLRERLITRRLLQPLESSLAFRNALRIEEVREVARQLLLEHPALDELIAPRQAQVLKMLGQARIVGGPGMLLTVLAENRPEALRHSVMVAMICVWLADRLERPEAMVRSAAEAGLMHDIGELYLSPEVLEPAGRLSFIHWRALCVHPLVACSLLRESKVYGEAAAVAVREHHERVDGSGYPSGTGTISPLGRILLVAEVLATLMASGASAAARVDIALRMIPGQFPREVVEVVLERLREIPQVAAEPSSAGDISSAMTELLQRLEAARCEAVALAGAQGLSEPQVELAVRLEAQLARYTAAIHETGAPEISGNPDWLIAAPEVAVEVGRIIREMSWQLPGLLRHAELMVNSRAPDPSLWQPLLTAMHIRVQLAAGSQPAAPVPVPDME
jgi:HD-GYP domain-containing protein (c-di-GMP phosphodiesterase class II)